MNSRSLVPMTAVLLAVATACSDDDEDDDALPLATTTQMRGLPFLSTPRVKHRDRAQYLEDSKDDYQAASDDWADRLYDVYGRLGFFGRDRDVRSASSASVELAGAFYSPDTDAITLIGKPSTSLLVHELVHALQDQHFDLVKLEDSVQTLDERTALAGLVEGDAQLAQDRFQWKERREDPLDQARALFTPEQVQASSERTLERANEQPTFFFGRWAFAYTYGVAYAAARAGVFEPTPRWNTGSIDDTFRSAIPASTEQVMKRGDDNDEIVRVGIDSLPPAVYPGWDVTTVDRIGAWYTYVLLRPANSVAAKNVARAWDGDQLVVLEARDASVPAKSDAKKGILWTSQWDTIEDSMEAERLLATVHGFDSDGGFEHTAKDGESVRLERRLGRMVFAKNLPTDIARELSNAAFSGNTPLEPTGVVRFGRLTHR